MSSRWRSMLGHYPDATGACRRRAHRRVVGGCGFRAARAVGPGAVATRPQSWRNLYRHREARTSTARTSLLLSASPGCRPMTSTGGGSRRNAIRQYCSAWVRLGVLSGQERRSWPTVARGGALRGEPPAVSTQATVCQGCSPAGRAATKGSQCPRARCSPARAMGNTNPKQWRCRDLPLTPLAGRAFEASASKDVRTGRGWHGVGPSSMG